MSENINTKPIIDLFFKQPFVLFNHLFGSYHQFIEEIIPYSLVEEPHYIYEHPDNDVIYRYGFKFTNVRIKPPFIESNNEYLFPKYARKNFLNYFSQIICKVQMYQEKIDVLTNEKTIKIIAEKDKELGSVPVMTKSKYCTTQIKNNLKGECNYDPGGYFIVSGQEKVIISIEKMVDNQVLVFTKKDSSYKDGLIYITQINSRKYNWSDNLQILTIKNKKNGSLNLNMSQLSDVPLFVFLRALGMESDKEIISYITNNLEDLEMLNILRNSVNSSITTEGKEIKNKDDAIEFLITKLRKHRRITQSDPEIALMQKRMFLRKVLTSDVLPHLGPDLKKKAIFICYMTKRLIEVQLGRRSPDDRDALQNKRVETPGVLLGQLFRQNLKKMLNEVGKQFRKKNNSDEDPINVINLINSTTITQGIKTGLATGIWGMNRTKKGVAQSLQRLSWVQSISYLRRIMSPSLDPSTQKVTSIRHLNNIQYGFMCPTQTPEGGKIGIVKSLAFMSTISFQNDSQVKIIKDLISDFKKVKFSSDINPLDFNSWIKVFINGDLYCMTKKAYELFLFLKIKRKEGKIDKFVSISLNFNFKEIYIYSDGGRLIRPLMAVKDGKLLLTQKINNEIKEILNSNNSGKGWFKIISKYPEIIEYEDIVSSNYIMIAEDQKYLKESYEARERNVDYSETTKINRYGDYRFINYTHCEMDSWLILGLIAANIPYSDRNAGMRNIINFSQSKQAMGVYLTSHKDRMDISHILYNPSVPIVQTRAMEYNNMLNLPNGENVIVAIMSYGGYNQEDSIILNKSAIDRGLFRADSVRKYHSEISKNPSTSQNDIFTKPDPNKVTSMKQANYNKLNDKGFAPEETEISNGDIIIGKVSPIQPTGEDSKVYKDSSVIFKSNVDGVIDRVHNNIYNSDGYEMYNIRVRMERKPVIGDKFTNRHGQKGTVGILMHQKDMPFTESGLVPDLIMNPHAIPSRMTVGQLAECMAAKIGALESSFVDGTPFQDYDIHELPKMLKKLGYSSSGTETMYCGVTGKKMQAEIFIGPTYCMRLKHMVQDKVHSRGTGPRQALTRQPLEGRSRDGGLKIGEMEKDAMVAHGIGQFLKERMMETSDITKVTVCDECGLFAQKVMDKDYYTCPICPDCNKFSEVCIPYAFKLLVQELMSVNILPMIKTERNIFDDNV
jgi:DNA-directed RNA polymerase II subunit RPB2